MVKKQDILNTDFLYAWSQTSDELYHDVHCHAEYEIYYFISGDVEYRIEGRRFIMAPESLLLIPPNCFHGVTVKSAEPHRRVSIHFLSDFLDETERNLLLKMFHARRVYYPDLSRFAIGFLIQSVLDCKKMKGPLQKTALKHRAISLLTHIYQIRSRDITDSAPVNERIQAILWYLNSNLQTNISLEQIVRRFQVSRNHLNVLFRKETGTTINQYIRIKRLALARQEMRNGCNAEEAAYKAGFHDYSNFYRAYKAFFGVMPSAKKQRNSAAIRKSGLIPSGR
jgi:AraC-like DNA-binding protein